MDFLCLAAWQCGVFRNCCALGLGGGHIRLICACEPPCWSIVTAISRMGRVRDRADVGDLAAQSNVVEMMLPLEVRTAAADGFYSADFECSPSPNKRCQLARSKLPNEQLLSAHTVTGNPVWHVGYESLHGPAAGNNSSPRLANQFDNYDHQRGSWPCHKFLPSLGCVIFFPDGSFRFAEL